jgi:hypothetical protein
MPFLSNDDISWIIFFNCAISLERQFTYSCNLAALPVGSTISHGGSTAANDDPQDRKNISALANTTEKPSDRAR